ncbi:NUDIX domain-containing protein [Loktanella sp. DJP18]|uniref:NUDIX domain-containing protein n=1 Tax=Loktanella sp. DJP18 TaxID=3409788 RepID=UPI003BB51296
MTRSKTSYSNTPVLRMDREDAYKGFFKIGRYTGVVEKFDGTPSEPFMREVFERGTAAAVLPFDAKRNRVLLIRQFLIGAHLAGVDNRPLQVIAGMIEPGETGMDVARREAAEEAGCEIDWVRPAQAFLPSPGGTSERIQTFVARADLPGDLGITGTFGLDEEQEDIQAQIFDADDAIAMLDAGEIEAGPAVVVLSWFARHHAALRKEWS